MAIDDAASNAFRHEGDALRLRNHFTGGVEEIDPGDVLGIAAAGVSHRHTAASKVSYHCIECVLVVRLLHDESGGGMSAS